MVVDDEFDVACKQLMFFSATVFFRILSEAGHCTMFRLTTARDRTEARAVSVFFAGCKPYFLTGGG
jgi:hypothetical protein